MTIKRIVLWRGPSTYDGTSITAYLAEHGNTKTGPVIGLIVAPSKGSYWQHRRSGSDYSVCGACEFRVNRTCYVGNGSNVGMGVNTTLVALEGAPVHDGPLVAWLRSTGLRTLRSAVWGDAAALPPKVWQALEHACTLAGLDVLGYTHGHRTLSSSDLEHLRSTHVQSLEGPEVPATGWRYFRAVAPGTAPGAGEFACPASAEQGHKTTCGGCLACGSRGNQLGQRSAVIWQHDTKGQAQGRRLIAGLLDPASSRLAKRDGVLSLLAREGVQQARGVLPEDGPLDSRDSRPDDKRDVPDQSTLSVLDRHHAPVQ